MLYASASQTVGPFLHIGLDWLNRDPIAGDGVSGERITLEGRLVDGGGQPVSDGLIEIWQANAHGRYAHPEDMRDLPLEPGFTGFGRCATDGDGRYRFRTVKPGRVPGPAGRPQAPHVAVAVFARGLLKPLHTRLYFAHEHSNAEDWILHQVPVERRNTLMAKQDGTDKSIWRFDIVLQGEHETVFFDF